MCGEISEIEYRAYLKRINFDNLYYCRKNKCFTKKVEKSNLQKYGVEHTSKLEYFQNKWKQTNIEKYGCENVFQNEEIKEKIRQFYRDNYNAERNTQVKYVRDNNGWIPDEELSDYKKYNRLCRKYTNRNKKILFKNWDGYDYYDSEYIKDNFVYNFKNYNYPTIDHKISIKCGFLNNIDEHIISSIDNLCITKSGLNSLKRIKIEDEFIIFLNKQKIK